MPCLQPYTKKNPNYGLKHIGYNFLKDCDSQYIDIPCGYCPNCVAVKQMYLVQRVQMESLYNHLFFGTLTYSNECLPHIDVNGHDIRYADREHLVLTIKRLRNDCAFGRNDWRYFFVSELGHLKGRPHFHILFLFPKLPKDTYYDCLNLERVVYDKLKDYWSYNVGTNRKPIYKPRFEFVQKYIHGHLKTNYDLHYVNPALTPNGTSDVAFYIMKYMLKYSVRTLNLQRALRLNLDDSDYRFFWNLVKPTYQSSLGFGFNTFHGKRDSRIIDYLHSCVLKTPNGMPYPCYFNPNNGMSFPLSPFYRNVSDIYPISEALRLYYNADKSTLEKDSYNVAIKKFMDYEKKISSVESHGDTLTFDEFCY